MSDFATEKTHWYDKQGNPQHTYINSKGKECNTTLREARKFRYYPSVMGIIKLARNVGLDNWITDQIILACLTMPKVHGESEENYIKRLKEDAKAQAKKAADKGTLIHGYIERGFSGKLELEDEGYDFYLSVEQTICNECGGEQKWHTEKSFAISNGYGGKVDLINDLYLIDFKGTDKDLATIKTYDEHAMQLAAYDNGIKNDFFPSGRKCGICYIHRDTAESKLLWIPEKDLLKGWFCFKALLDFYYAKTGLERP